MWKEKKLKTKDRSRCNRAAAKNSVHLNMARSIAKSRGNPGNTDKWNEERSTQNSEIQDLFSSMPLPE